MSGLQRDDADSEQGKTYAMLIADTVVVKAGGGPPDVATALAPRDWKDVAYYLKVRLGWREGLGCCRSRAHAVQVVAWCACPGRACLHDTDTLLGPCWTCVPA